MAKLPRAAKDEKKGGARAKFLEEAKARKPRPAKVEPGSLREKAAKGITKKTGVSGTSTEARRIADAKKSRGPFGQLVPRKDNVPAKAEEPKRGIVKYEEPKRGIVKYEGSKPSAGGMIGTGLRALAPAAWRAVGGPVTMLIAQTKPAGEGSDKPTGPLMKGGKQPGYKYLPDKGGGPVKRQGSSAPSMARAGGGPEKRQGGSAPSVASPAAPKKAEPKKEAKKAPEKKTFAKKVEAPAKPTFRGNWVNAAPTAMQARLGKKISGRRTFGRDR